MRCIACNEIIDDFTIKLTKQDEFCSDCLAEINKMLYFIPDVNDEIEIIDIDDLEDEI